MRNHNQPVEKTGLGDVGDAAVDDDAGIEDLVTLLARPLAAKDAAERRQIQQISLVRAHRQSHVGHDHHDHDLQKTLGRARRNAVANAQREKISAKYAEYAADSGPNQALQTHCAQPPLEHNDRRTDQQTGRCSKVCRQVKRTNEKADNADNKDQQNAYENDVH